MSNDFLDDSVEVPTTAVETDSSDDDESEQSDQSGAGSEALTSTNPQAGASVGSFTYDPILPWTGDDDAESSSAAAPGSGTAAAPAAGSARAAAGTVANSPTLAFTGTETTTLGYLGAGLIALGGLMLWLAPEASKLGLLLLLLAAAVEIVGIYLEHKDAR